MERDISKDRAILAAAAPGVWEVSHRGSHDGYDVEGPEPGLRGAFAHEEDALFCVAAHNEIVPHYLARCEHLERMVDAAFDALTKPWMPCPREVQCPQPNVCVESEETCRQCWSDYLEQKVKEATK